MESTSAGDVHELRLVEYPDAVTSGLAAAREAAEVLRVAIRTRQQARVVFASAPSQEEFLKQLVAEPDLDWSRVHAFHMDEYIGLAPGAPQSFAQWLLDRLPRIRFEAIAPGDDPAAEAKRYASLVTAEKIDLTCLGIGVNGHIAFNEPGRCRFDDDQVLRLVTLDELSRQQQVDDGCFDSIDEVPTAAVTLTVPVLLSASRVVGTVLGVRKAPAVARMINDPIGPAFPATALRTHPEVTMYLDAAAASLVQ